MAWKVFFLIPQKLALFSAEIVQFGPDFSALIIDFSELIRAESALFKVFQVRYTAEPDLKYR